MQEIQIPLLPTKAKELEMPPGSLHALVDGHTGNGRIMNERPAGPFAGLVVWNMVEDTALGRKHRHNFLSLDSAYWQFQAIFDQAMDEAGRIAGPSIDSSAKDLGELSRLRENRRLLDEWNNLTGEQKLDIGLFYGGMAAVRGRARNRLNVSVGQRTSRMQSLKDKKDRYNPGAIRAQSVAVEREDTERALFIVRKVVGANNRRYVNVLDWLIKEDEYTDGADYALESLAEQPDDPNRLGDVYSAVSLVRFRVHAFNHLAHAREQTSGRIAESDIRITQRGIEFDRTRWDLMKPFRQLAALTVGRVAESYTQQADEHLPEIAAVIGELGETSIGGAYDHVVDNLSSLAEQTAEALNQKGRASQVHALAKKFKLRITHYGFPGEAHYDNWYHDQLYGQRRH